MGKMKWIIVIAMFLTAAVYSMPYETELVNGYKIVKGERPLIDLSQVPVDAYEPGKLTIKFKEGVEAKSSQRFIKASTKGFAEVGIESVDMVSKSVGALQFDRKFYSLLEIPEGTVHSVAKFKDRHEAWGFHRVYEIEIPVDQDVIAAVKQYAALPEIEYAEPVYKKALHEPAEVGPAVYEDNIPTLGDLPSKGSKWVPNDPNYATLQWHYNNSGQSIGGVVGIPGVDTRAVTAWDIEKGNPLFITAVIDQGIDYDHPDIAANMWSGIGWDFGNNDSTIEPDDHGSHTSATISGVTNNGIGIAGLAGGDGTAGTGSKVMSCQVFGSTSGGFDAAFIWAADQTASISQNSWGYTSAGVFEQSVLDAIDYFNANGGQDGGLVGGITIFAAGNNGTDAEWYPGYYDGTMAVASHDNKGKKSSFSNYGTWVDITAPGTNVYSCNGTGGYMVMSGTSMACPHVSGAAAMIVANSEGVLTAAELRTILEASVWNVYAYETNTLYAGKLGTGALDASSALVLTQEYLGGVPTGGSLAASGVSTSQIDLSWTLNEFNDNVLVAWALEGNTIGDPVDGTVYSVGNSIPGGGTVIYYGNGTSYSHTGLTAETGYIYEIWSRAGAERQDNQGEWYQVGTYSNSKSAGAETLMEPLPPSASSMGFENSGYIPNGWTQAGGWTFVTTSTRPTAPSEGSYFAYLKPASAATSKLVTPRFDFTGYSNVTLTFKYVTTYLKSGPNIYNNNLKVYYKTSLSGSWVQLGSEYSGNYTTWQSGSLNISDAVLSNDFYVAFEGIYQGGYGVSVDDIIINGTPVGGTPPAAPSLISPANASSSTDLTPTFDWNDVSGATSYTIQIDNNSGFTSVDYTNSPTASTYTPASNLPVGTWYWRVLATNANGSSAYTSGWSVILGSAPAAPSLAAPTDASTLYILKPAFDWNDVSGATSYNIQADNNSNFGSPEIDETVSVSNYTPTADMALGTYYWKVLSTNSFGSSAYSGTWTVILAPLSAPINVTTTPGATDITVSWDAVSGATSYDVYSSTDPYGTFTFVTNVATTSYLYTPASETKLFWYVVAKN
ncbi:MAG: S8 family serine peptidase [Candidatus Gastranaerophilales bacterium]|nr:S8 family serine peptidase [Candidatus Gastranaerophilales bacterium]